MSKKNDFFEDYENDLEETDDQLDSSGDQLEFWEEKQRELITSTVDYNLGSLADLAVDLSPKYQRRQRWDNKRQSKLIESFLMNVPVPPIFLNEDSYGKYSVIDGKQRLTSIKRFLKNKLKLEGLSVFSELNNKFFNDLPETLQNAIRTRPNLRTIIILRQSDDDVKYEVFQRLNTGGVRLNPQEIRNSAFPGKFNDLVLSLSENPEFHNILRIQNKEKSRIYKEMRDAEFVLRFFTFYDSWKDYKGNMKLTLDASMKEHQTLSKPELDKIENLFLDTVRNVNAAFGDYAFRRYVPETDRWRKQILAALFEGQMIACIGRSKEGLTKNQKLIISKTKELFSNSEFRKSTDSATNNPGPFEHRIAKFIELIDEVLQ